MKRTQAGFSLIEILVVVAIIAILSAILYVNVSEGSAQSRDAQRQADMRIVSSALELYKNKYGQYPAACNGPTLTHNNPVWSGQNGSGYNCSGNNVYIVGLAPEFIPRLPVDPKLNSSETYSGYVYTVNNARSVYKFMALNTVETESVAKGDVFYRCGAEYQMSYNLSDPTWVDPPLCRRTRTSPSGNNSSPDIIPNSQKPQCENVTIFRNDYAVSGGYSSDNRGNANTPQKGYEYDTEIVRCN